MKPFIFEPMESFIAIKSDQCTGPTMKRNIYYFKMKSVYIKKAEFFRLKQQRNTNI